MRTRLLANLALLGMGVLLLQGLTGCATSSDLEKLNVDLGLRMEGMNSTVESMLKEIRQDLKAAQTAQEETQREVTEVLNTIRSEGAARLEDLVAAGTRRTQTLHELKQETAEARKEVREYAEKSVEDLGKIAAVAAEVKAELQSLQQATRQTLIGTYQAEEASLRERLKVVTKVRQNLESVTTKSAEQPTE